MESAKELNLETVKKVTQQLKSYGFENYSIPLFEWRLVDIFKSRSLNDEFTLESEVFPLKYYPYMAQLTLTHSSPKQWNLTLHLDSSDPDQLSSSKKFLSVPFFVCKCRNYASWANKNPLQSQRCFLSTDAFNPQLHKQKLHFLCHVEEGSTNTVIAIYQEPEAACLYVSPYDKTVVGKIEKFSQERLLLGENQSLIVSPRFNFGPHHQPMIVRFWYANLNPGLKEKGLSATLHFLERSEPRDFTFVATFTLFSQNIHKTNMEKKLVLLRDVNKYSYPVFLAFYEELEDYLDKDTLYYKVVVERCK